MIAASLNNVKCGSYLKQVITKIGSKSTKEEGWQYSINNPILYGDTG
jgi:hypothetical protein